MKQVLLLTDFSQNSWEAIEYGMEFFKNDKVNFHIFHVKDMRGFVSDDLIGNTGSTTVQETLLGEIKAELKRTLAKVQEVSKNELHSFTTACVYSPFFKAVTQYCESNDISFVIMGTTGATGAKRVFLGSTASRIINRLNIPVLAIPSGYVHQAINNIVLPVDYKVDFLPLTLLPLFEILDTFNPELKILYVNEKEEDLTDGQVLNREEIIRIFDEYNTSYHTVTGHDLDVVLGCITEFLASDMVVMIKKEKTMVAQFFNNTHIRKVSYFTRIPLLVLPENQVLID